MTLADEEPSGAITMRAVASRLGVRSPMALYRYVASKDGLRRPAHRRGIRHDHHPGRPGMARSPARPRTQRMGGDAAPPLGRPGWPTAARRSVLHALRLYDAALAELDPLDLDASIRMGFINTVLGHVFGSGLALLEERTMRARTGQATDADLNNAVVALPRP